MHISILTETIKSQVQRPKMVSFKLQNNDSVDGSKTEVSRSRSLIEKVMYGYTFLRECGYQQNEKRYR